MQLETQTKTIYKITKKVLQDTPDGIIEVDELVGEFTPEDVEKIRNDIAKINLQITELTYKKEDKENIINLIEKK